MIFNFSEFCNKGSDTVIKPLPPLEAGLENLAK